MYKDKRFIAIIPARGGSKRLPKKNILPFLGKPLISWTINEALESSYIDLVTVSSEDQEILSVSKKNGAHVIHRPMSLARDESNSVDVIVHVLEYLKLKYDYFILLQATSPLRTSEYIDGAIEYLINKEADSVVSVTETEHNPLWSNVLPEDGNMKGFIKKDIEGKRSQDLKTYFRLNGAIYVVNIKKFLKFKTFMLEKTYAFIMPQDVSIDIDSISDFVCAEAILKYKNN